MQQVDTPRLILRRWRFEDHHPYATLCCDPLVMQYIGDGSSRTYAQSVQAIERFEEEWQEKGHGLFAVEERATGNFIGFTGLSSPNFMPELSPAVEIGWRFSRSHWGKGYASEAAQAALSFGLEDLKVSDVVSICQTDNSASIRIMKKLGLVFDRQSIDPTCNRAIDIYRLPRKPT